MLKDAILLCLKKGKVKKEDIDLYFGGDLNNQITACYYYAVIYINLLLAYIVLVVRLVLL